MNYPDGNTYEGAWEQDQRSGKGKMTWKVDQGSTEYTGDWKKDMKHG